MKLRIGTRRSLLAMTQTKWVARQIAQMASVEVDLIGIDTRGDQILDRPLQELEGKEFFVAELDNALKSGHVDLTVHSLKDLSVERPAGFSMIVPKREMTQDLLLVHKDFFKTVFGSNKRHVMRVGSSSPRRQENILPFLKELFPNLDFEWMSIRGNVPTRLSRLGERCDAVVLATAGLNRLYNDTESRPQIEAMIRESHKMIIPLLIDPCAPGQGALAIEYLSSRKDVESILSGLHCPESAGQISIERDWFKSYGGGCHQAFGVAALAMSSNDEPHPTVFKNDDRKQGWVNLRGKLPDGTFANRVRKYSQNGESKWEVNDLRPISFDFDSRQFSLFRRQALKVDVARLEKIYLSSIHALSDLNVPKFYESNPEELPLVFVAGVKSLKKCFEKGIWVHGCTENLGENFFFEKMGSCHFLDLDKPDLFTCLTHADSTHSKFSQVMPTYRLIPEESVINQASKVVQSATTCFWSSGSAFNAIAGITGINLMKAKQHFSGPGKTYEMLKGLGLQVEAIWNND